MSNVEFGEGGETGRFLVDLDEVQALHESGQAPDAYSALYGATLDTVAVQQRIEEIRSVWTYGKYVEAVRQIHRTHGSVYEQPNILPRESVSLPKYIPPQVGSYIPRDFYNSKGEARHAVIERYTARNFFQLFKTEVGNSPDIATFAWRIKAAADPQNIHRAEQQVPSTRYRTAYDSNLYVQLKQYMKAHPESATEAFTAWEEAVDSMLAEEDFQRTLGLRQVIESTLVSANMADIDNKSYRFTRPNIQKYLERPTALPRDTKEILNYVAMAQPDSSHRTLQVYEEFDELLSNPETVPKGTGGKLMQAGLDILVRFLESASVLEAGMPEKDRLAANLVLLLETAKKNSGAFNFILINKLANTGLILGKLQQSATGANLVPLSEELDALDDLPQAIDWISIVVNARLPETYMTELKYAQFKAAVHCARRAVQEGSGQKSKQKVLSEYDMILRYPDVTPYQLDALMSEMQRAQSAKEPDIQAAAHRLYRAMPTRRNQFWFKRYEPGSGHLT